LALKDLTDPGSVLRAIDEFERVGRDAFLRKYGFGPSRSYFVRYKGGFYDSKAILGAAHGYQHPERGPMPNTEFSGGEQATARQLRLLGFTVDGTAPAPAQEDADEDEGRRSRRNPAWNREELILALDAYIRWQGNPPNKTSAEIAKLSAEIGGLRRSLGTEGDEKLRNANGVYMKLMNFRRFDPRFYGEGKVGLTRGNRLEQEVWDEFACDPARLHQVADAIRTSVATGNAPTPETGAPASAGDPSLDAAVDAVTAALPPERRECIRELVVRNRRQVAELKVLYGGRCQVSGKPVLDGLAGDITEVHHIKWLTRGGLDTKDNMVVLAPDVHAAIHAADATFDWSDLSFVLNGHKLPLALNLHLKPRPS
jgi:5-methylcytosine-specific restriction protein A